MALGTAHHLDELTDTGKALHWLTQGGDGRIRLDAHGLNAYGLPQVASERWLGLGSSTATPLSASGLAAIAALHARWQLELQPRGPEAAAAMYAREMQRLRGELTDLYGLAALPGSALVFASSGTEVHRLAVARLADRNQEKTFSVIMMAASETGSQVRSVLRAAGAGSVHNIALRTLTGRFRAATQIAADTAACVAQACAHGGRALLIAVDVSKSGLLAPDIETLLELKQRWRGQLEVLVDACQGRLAPATVQAWLQADCLLALTGSKFIAGPAFSGLLLLPPRWAADWAAAPVPAALRPWSLRGDWPPGWNTAALMEQANLGLLLRWQAALAELRPFLTLGGPTIHHLLARFSTQVSRSLETLPGLSMLDQPVLDRRALHCAHHWDELTTLFPLLLPATQSGTWLAASRVQSLQRRLLQAAGKVYQFGQPVICGEQNGEALAALRLCASARLVVEMAAGETAALALLQSMDEALAAVAELAQQRS